LQAGTEGGPLLHIQAAAGRRGLTVTLVDSTGSHTRYRIGAQQVVLPTPIPDAVAQQVIENLEHAA
ncbi:hypothetical protein GTW69_32150, partial [Streptomyces sp. SID7760]|nr:hypothetical protein [Streptomyces sp. SID7760]